MAFISVGALTEVIALPEKVAVTGVVGRRIDLQQRSSTCASVVDHDIHDERVLVDFGSTSVRGDAMRHHITDSAIQIPRHLHNARIFTINQRRLFLNW